MSNLVEYNQDQLKLLRDTVCKGANENEFKLFLYVASKTGLDPLTKQIYAVKRWNSKLSREEMTVQTGIDGFRVVAERSGKYAGQLGPYWCGEDGTWLDVWLKKDNPMAAKVGVLRSDFKEPLWAVASYESYVQKSKDGKPTKFWSQMPELMIAKVAESLALRKAFPQDLSGIYTPEEFDQSENDAKQTRYAPTTTVAHIQKPIIKEPEIDLTEKIDEIDEINETKIDPPIIKTIITREQASRLKSEGETLGYDLEGINYVVYQKTKKLKWGELYTFELDEILKHMHENKRK